MGSEIRDLLTRLLDAPGPSGHEAQATAVWREAAESFADRVWTDIHGNAFAEINPDGSPTVMMAAGACCCIASAKPCHSSPRSCPRVSRRQC